MPLSWNEIKSRAFAFSKRWADAGNEESEAKPFLIDFFEVFGITNKRVASFEHAVRKFDGRGRIDLFWPGILLVEMKSRGRDLDRAYTQAMDYFHGISERDLPRYVLVSDFARFRLQNLDDDEVLEFGLADLHRHVKDFGFIAGYQTQVIQPQDPINVRAAESMGRLHDQLKAVGYDGSPLEVYLVRLLFCLFAEDTGIFEKRQFQDYIEQRTGEDSSDLAYHMAALFQVLNTSPERRLTNTDEALAAFPYINGRLFEAALPMAGFDSAMRESLLDLCALDWSRISPAVFGSLFQSIMDEKARRNLGAHYTSEENILKLIKPLFLDELWAEFEKIRGNRNRLFDFHKRLRQLHFFDPACGCGNFLVITYRELRTLELEVLRAAYADGQMALDIHQIIQLDVDQFHGIELEEFPAQIAQVALWLTDHQMNLKVSEEFGSYFARIPLKQAANIVHGNALRMDWNDLLPAERCSYVLGNPPFIGHHLQDAQQKADLVATYGADAKAAGVMDYVTAWYLIAARYIRGTRIKAAFASTNSITQGEQVGILWRNLLREGPLHIHFAHRTFKWSNEARGKAAVYCVIVGFAAFEPEKRVVFDYDRPDGEPHAVAVSNLNAYLVDAPWVLLENRSRNPFGKPEMLYGSKPTDNGHFLFTDEEKIAFLRDEPGAAGLIKPFISAHEYLHAELRWVLWLVDADPRTINELPQVKARVRAVDAFRKASKAASTREYPSRHCSARSPNLTRPTF